MKNEEPYYISGIEDGHRVESRVLEEQIQRAVSDGYRLFEVEAYGQHGIGGRLWRAGDEPVRVNIKGSSGQRVGSMGFPNTQIEIFGPASDDVGWLNAGAEIAIHGNAANGVANAMAQGKVYIAGSVGARAMTMTKHNPRFDPPELWILGTAGDYFAEFMAGGIAVICGFEGQDPTNVLGHRPCVGMVGGKVFFRGSHKGFSHADAKLIPINEDDWQWLKDSLEAFLGKIDCSDLFEVLSKQDEWQLLAARSPFEKAGIPRRSMHAFCEAVWEKELGKGGMIADLASLDRSQIPLISTGELRRFVPVWENRKFMAPCQASCPTGIPVQERWRLIRQGRVDEAVDMALAYTPFPATVCGYLCPNLCMQGCTRQTANMVSLDVRLLGKASLDARLPELPPLSGKRIAVIGGGPAGISVAWQLRQKGHEAVVFDMEKTLGGKIVSAIPGSRIPEEIVGPELERVRKVLPHVHLQQRLTNEDIERLKADFDFVVIAIGAHKPRLLPVRGKDRILTALTFLRQSKQGIARVGKRVVIIGAGNVGCDVAAEAHRVGAEEITLIHYRRPPAFGEEKEAAEAIGAKFRWPCSTRAVTEEGVELTTGEVIPADTVIMATGHEPDLGLLPETVDTDGGFIKVNEIYQTTDPQIFAIGDAVKLGMLTDAIGAGRKAAQAINDIFTGKRPQHDTRQMIDYLHIQLEYFDPRMTQLEGIEGCAGQCSSCGVCRDCGVCEAICPEGAISRQQEGERDFEMVVNPDKCIGCGFCAGACPCGVWNLVDNDPLEY